MALDDLTEPDTTVTFSDGREFPDPDAFPDGKQRLNPNQADIMWQSIDYLVREYDLDERINIPYPPNNQEVVINRRERHPSGNPFRGSRELSYGNFVETSFNKNQKENHILRLADECGLGVEFGDWP